MKKIKFPKSHDDALKGSVMLTGIFRSGTTILGKLVGSMKNVEFSYDPPLISTLDYLIMNRMIDKEIAAGIFRTYMAEDIMLNYHHGRGYNMRPDDGSCIFNMKTKEDVDFRWKNIKGVNDAIRLMHNLKSRLVFKSVIRYTIIPTLLKYYEGMKIVEIERDPRRVLSSVLAKRWFDPELMQKEDYTGNWPYHPEYEDKNIPYFADEKTASQWDDVNDVTRTVRILNALIKRKNEVLSEIKKDFPGCYISVRYEDLLKDPKKVVRSIEEFTGLEQTSITKNLISTVRATKSAFDTDMLMKECDDEDRKEFEMNIKELGYS